nr:reverse transcriptase domain-containing protein [Tanacetum cinerariifolium]
MPKLNPIISNSPTTSPFLKDCTLHIPYTQENMFKHDKMSNHVGDEELKSMNGTGSRVLTNKELKKDEMELSAQDVLKIIKNKSKVRNSINKPIISQVKASNVDSSEITSVVASVVTSVMTAMFKQHQVTPAIASVKAVEESSVTSGGAHSYRRYPATNGNTFLGYQDNIQGYVSAAAVNYNQGNAGYRPQSVANQFWPLGFAQPNVQNQGFNQNRENNFNQGNTSYQAPIQQTQVATLSDLEKFKKTNEASMQAMRNHISNLKSELRSEMHFLQMNTASTLGTGPLPSNTIANSKGELKAITTRSGVSYEKPPIPPPFSFLPKVVKRVPEVTKDTVKPSTENIQPSVVQTQVLINELFVAPKLKPTMPYPSRMNKHKLCEKDDKLALNFLEIFRKLHFELSFADALLHMPKFSTMFKSLLNNKEKIFDLAITPVNENCSAAILKKLLEKLGDPSKFLIPCDFSELVECLALADLGASINLMPLSIWEKLSLPELTPTQMILELADRSTTRLAGIAEDVFVKVGKFHFSTDFVVVDYVVDPQVSLILERPFLRTGRALIDVYGEELTLRVDDKAIIFKVGQTLKYSYNDAESINRIDVINVACEEYSKKCSGSQKFLRGGDFILEEIEACLASKSIPPGIDDTDFDPEGDILLFEKLLNDDPSSRLPPKELNLEELKTVKSSIDDPPSSRIYLLILMHDGYFHDMIEETMKVFMDYFSVFGDSFSSCLSHLDKMLKRCEDTNLVLNWEKCHFMVKEGIVLGQKISKSGIELQEFDVIIHDKKGAENLAADHLSRLENPHQSDLEKKEITKTFPLKTLGMVTFRDYLPKWVEAKALPTNDARVVVKFLKSLFARFGTPRAIISDRGTHFCNDQFAKVILKYRVTHRLSTAYHPQTSGQVEVSNHGLKRIIERTVGENRASWSDKLDDALWAFRTAFKIPIGIAPDCEDSRALGFVLCSLELQSLA